MIDYQVFDSQWTDYFSFDTIDEAKEWMKEQVDRDPACAMTDFVIYKRERISA